MINMKYMMKIYLRRFVHINLRKAVFYEGFFQFDSFDSVLDYELNERASASHGFE